MAEETARVDMRTFLAGLDPDETIGGRYRPVGVLGHGGTAVVLGAHDELLDRPVAVKVLSDSATDAADRARFVDEARLLAGLCHPHVVTLLDAGFTGHRPFLVMERVDGETLADAMAGGGLDPERLAAIGAALASALAYAHAHGVVHRDVKPGNVLLRADGAVKLADFGIARILGETAHHTRTGMLVGTVAYLAPEQVAGEPLTTAVDVYALGLVLLEALTGAKAFEGSSVESALARLTRQPVVPRTLPRRWRDLIGAMTARDPGRRPTAAQVAARLSGPMHDRADVAAAPARRWRAAVVPVGAAALVLALAGGLAMSRADAPRHPAARAATTTGRPAASPTPVAQASVPAAAATTDAGAAAVPVVAPVSGPAAGAPRQHAHRAARHHRGRHHRARHHRHHRHHGPPRHHHRHPKPPHHHHKHHKARHHHHHHG